MYPCCDFGMSTCAQVLSIVK
ncbi:hypothetical protein A2U01_0093487, partial [Trifolium medium]|nr:hypothetical protein [Trifolium medium]